MKTEKGVMIVAYKESRGNNRFLVLERDKNWEGYETPKGRLEEDDYEETVRIELEEEAGIDESQIEKLEDLDETVSWEYERDGEKRQKKYRVFAVKVGKNAAVDVTGNPDREHSRGMFLRFEDAEALLTHEDNIEVLETVRGLIS